MNIQVSLIKKLISIQSLNVHIELHPHAWGPKWCPWKSLSSTFPSSWFSHCRGSGTAPSASLTAHLKGGKRRSLSSYWPFPMTSERLFHFLNLLHRTVRTHSGHLKVDEISSTKHPVPASQKNSSQWMSCVDTVGVNGFSSVCLPPPHSHTPYRAWALSFTSLHFSLFASQAGSRSADQGGCLGCIINYWPQAHAVPDRPGVEALCTEIPPVETKKEGHEEELCFYILHLRIHCSVLMDFSDYSYCKCWTANFHRNSRYRYFPLEGNFSHRRVRSALSSVSGWILQTHMWRACQRQCAAPAWGLSSAQWSAAVPSKHVPLLSSWERRCWQWLVSVSCAPLSSLRPLSPVLHFYLGPPLAAPGF